MRETLRFETNVPVEVALAFDTGKPVEGRYGDQLLYTLTDDRVMYVPPIVGDHIQKLGIGRDEPFLICKAEVKNGSRRSIEWKVARQRPAPTPTVQVEPAPAPASAAVTPVNGNNKTFACQAEADPLSSMAAVMLTALSAAVDVAHLAEQYAVGKGLNVRFASEDVRAIALTLYIGSNRGGAR